jgi:hypothetical protein
MEFKSKNHGMILSKHKKIEEQHKPRPEPPPLNSDLLQNFDANEHTITSLIIPSKRNTSQHGFSINSVKEALKINCGV